MPPAFNMNHYRDRKSDTAKERRRTALAFWSNNEFPLIVEAHTRIWPLLAPSCRIAVGYATFLLARSGFGLTSLSSLLNTDTFVITAEMSFMVSCRLIVAPRSWAASGASSSAA